MKHTVFAIATFSLVLAGGLAAPIVPSVLAQSAQDIVRSLEAPKVKMRSFQPLTQQEQRGRALIDKIQTRGYRQISVEERKEVAAFVEASKLPSIDIEIFFEYDSAAITTQAKPKLQTLGKALSDAKLKGQKFMIAGHTDARGSDAYNLALSQKRAESVKRFLVKEFKLDEGKLVVIGHGEEQLKVKDKPDAAENRRVQVVNLATK